MVERKKALHFPAVGERIDGLVRAIMAQQRRHVTLPGEDDKGRPVQLVAGAVKYSYHS